MLDDRWPLQIERWDVVLCTTDGQQVGEDLSCQARELARVAGAIEYRD